MGKFSTGSSALAQGNHQSQAKSYFIHIYLLDDGKKGNLGNFGQVWVSLGKFGQVGTSLEKATIQKNGKLDKFGQI